MKKLFFFLLIVFISCQVAAQKTNITLRSLKQQQFLYNADSTHPVNFTVDVLSSVANWLILVDTSGGNTLDHFNMYLDGTKIDEVPAEGRSYFYDCLVYGQDYTAGITAVYDWGETELVIYQFTSYFLFPPRNFDVSSTYGNPTISISFDAPLNCEGEVPVGLLSFNIYKDGDLIESIPYDDWINLINYDVIPGTYKYCVSAVYDLSSYGFPGQTGESINICGTVEVIWGIQLPFFEDWSSGSIESNSWQISSNNWKINTIEGNPEPSVEFSSVPPIVGDNYSLALTSTYLNADKLLVGKIFLDFDLKSTVLNQTETESFKIKVFNGTSWNTVYERTNTESFDWESLHLDISGYSLGQVFIIRFEANGLNSSNIENWMLDNIDIYRQCSEPAELEAHEYDFPNGESGVKLKWSAPFINSQGASQWLRWDDGENYSAMAADCDCKWTAAQRWSSNLMSDFNEFKVTKIKAFIYDNGYDYLVYKVWNGTEASDLLYRSDTIHNETGWVERDIDTTLIIDGSKEYWFGYTMYQLAPYFPLGVDNGPAIKGFGDKMQMYDSEWENLSDWGFNYNWNIAAYVESPPINTSENVYSLKNTGTDSTLTHFNIYRKLSDDSIYYFLTEVQVISGLTQYEYIESIEEHPTNSCYKVTAVWESETDFCESIPAWAKFNPDEDFVCVLVTNIETEKMNNFSNIYIFPNPATNQFNIQSKEEILQIDLINAFGQVVLTIQIKDKQAVVNTSGLQAGIYIVRVKTEKGIVNNRVVITK